MYGNPNPQPFISGNIDMQSFDLETEGLRKLNSSLHAQNNDTNQTAWEIINDAMQIMGGIGYTNVYPIERMLRDCRLAMIWTGTNEIMNLIIQHEYYRELLERPDEARNVEADAPAADEVDEKVYE